MGSLLFCRRPGACKRRGERSSQDVGGGFDVSAVQAVRKSLTHRVQISADELERQIGNLLAVVGDVFDQSRAETGLVLDSVELSIEIQLGRAGQYPRQRRQARRQGRHQAQLQSGESVNVQAITALTTAG